MTTVLSDTQDTPRDGIIELTFGEPDPALLAVRLVRRVAAAVLDDAASAALTYGPPAGLLATGLLPVAEARGVDFAPGARFCSDGDDRSLRLAFSIYDEATLTEGARRLGAAVTVAQAGRA